MQIQIERHTNANKINQVLNHPVVRPWVADDSEGVLDITPQVSNSSNILLMGEHGGCIFFGILPGIYEVHTQVLPEGRGRWARSLTDACAHWMFTRSDCWEITTRVPEGHTGAMALTIAAGMRHEFSRVEDGCKFRGKAVPCHIYSYRIQDWVTRAPSLVERGAWFHRRLGEEAARLGINTPAHSDDENHNRYVGACLEMGFAGQVLKGVAFYNRWAFLARHERVSLVSENPAIIDFDIGRLALREKDIEVLQCCHSSETTKPATSVPSA